MTAIVVAVLLALAPQGKADPQDDFDEVVVENAKEYGCAAAEVLFDREAPETSRLVRFDCPAPREDFFVAFIRLGEMGWFHGQMEWAPRTTKAPSVHEI